VKYCPRPEHKPLLSLQGLNLVDEKLGISAFPISSLKKPPGQIPAVTAHTPPWSRLPSKFLTDYGLSLSIPSSSPFPARYISHRVREDKSDRLRSFR
jgi:hypothetical protein